MDIVYKDYDTFFILGDEVNLISAHTDYGFSTVAEIKDQFYYMGELFPDITAAILAWQEINNKQLTAEQISNTISDNNLPSQGI